MVTSSWQASLVSLGYPVANVEAIARLVNQRRLARQAMSFTLVAGFVLVPVVIGILLALTSDLKNSDVFKICDLVIAFILAIFTFVVARLPSISANEVSQILGNRVTNNLFEQIKADVGDWAQFDKLVTFGAALAVFAFAIAGFIWPDPKMP